MSLDCIAYLDSCYEYAYRIIFFLNYIGYNIEILIKFLLHHSVNNKFLCKQSEQQHNHIITLNNYE
jgi:hypothetical protein